MRIRKYKWTMLIISGIIAGIVFTGCVWPVSEAEEDNSINYKSIFIEKLNAHWKLQIPELQDGSDTKIKEVGKGTGISFDNYSSEYFYYDDSDSAFVFNTPVSAPKTVNTKYARSELREMMGDDKTVNWDWNGRHCLDVTYNGSENDVKYEHDGCSVIVLGSGAYRIGSSVEFDWCGVSALNTIRKVGYRSVMINYNPETVSTDYDTCDRLYFDELSFERVMDIVELEESKGVIVSTGGQIPNNLAMRLHGQHVNILGTSPESIDRAEDRQKFSTMCDELGIDQPRWSELTSIEDIYHFVDTVGFPVLIRPSYVLSGAAMNVVSNKDELLHFLELAAEVSKDHPVVVSEFIEQAKEVEIDAVAQEGEVKAYAISEHVEFAGVHSGDATIVFPAQKLYVETIRRIKKIARSIAKELNISGPFNMQFLAKDNDIKVIECNLRASRSFPFVSKVLKYNFIDMATRIMLGEKVESLNKSVFDLDYVGVKASQFSFARLLKADPVLGVDMASTGEVGCIGENYYEAILKSMLSVGHRIPKKNILISSGPTRSKVELLNSTRMLIEKGYNIYSTAGTAKFFKENGIDTQILYWPDEDKEPNIMEYLHDRKIDLVINIPKNHTKRELDNGYKIRRAAIDLNIPLITNARLASAFINAFCTMSVDDIAIKSWAEYK